MPTPSGSRRSHGFALDELPADGPPLLVVITIDAHTEPTYAHARGGRSGAGASQRSPPHSGSNPAAGAGLQFQFVVQEGNDHELAPFLQYWTDLLACQGDGPWHDEVMFKRLGVGGGGPGQAEADARYGGRSGWQASSRTQGPVRVCLGASTVAA